MRTAVLAALVVAAALAVVAPASAALPREGVLVQGKTLGGIAVGMSRADVKRLWGRRFGRCRDCVDETWYFTYRPFEPQGAGVAFRSGRVDRVFTLWQPEGWHTPGGLEVGDPEAEVTRMLGALVRRHCVRYSALIIPGRRAQTAVYVYDGEVWGFGLTRPGVSPCV